MELINFDNCRQILEEYGNAVRNAYQDNLIRNGRIAGGKLLNSVEYRVDAGDRYYEVVLSLEEYWKYIEKGTAPHFPPVGKILEWVQVKPVLPSPDDQGRIPTPQQLAFLIARKISREGTKGTHDLEDAIDQVNDLYRDKIIIALQRDMGDYIQKVIVGTFTKNAMR